ncbi:MAG: polyprenyl synthetase family protein [Terrimicrobiaceae bacterium]|nr:polyprenyl synthetase family protein [Terrimicrobiaceae bacterium]
MDLDQSLTDYSRDVDRALHRWLPRESVRPATIHRAMRYSIFAGGKRMRPILCLAAAEACGGDRLAALPAACAVECVHTYSLIHDDLPCMDDDDMRRGRPTSHKVFGEGIAVLAGDALLTIAFEILGRTVPTKRHPTTAFFSELSRAAGSRFLVGGQVADLEGENRPSTLSDLRFIHRGKTAAMIVASLRLGAMSANATPAQLRGLSAFGENLGLAFQVIDDILDVTQTSEQLGKSAGKDVASGKTTYPSLLGLDRSRREAERLTRKALSALDPFGPRATLLRSLSAKLLGRQA